MTEHRTAAAIRHIQSMCNYWCDTHLEGIGHLLVDGVPGKATAKRIREIQYFLAFAQSDVDGKWSPYLKARMQKPFARFPLKGHEVSVKVIETGKRRRKRQRADYKKMHDAATATTGVGQFDGKPVANWIIPLVKKVRAGGRWKGWIVSGFRTPEYSEQLCKNMCGRPSCPGRCAGRATNHAKSTKPEGAIDVSDYYTFGAECQRLGIPLHNALGARDPVHFSSSGR